MSVPERERAEPAKTMLRTANRGRKAVDPASYRFAPATGDATVFDPEDPPRVEPSAPVAAAVHVALAEGHYLLGLNTPKAREGDPEGVHQLRTTTRRLRTALELFQGVVELGWAERLVDELKWLAGLLGTVRDLDVLTDRLLSHAEVLDGGTARALDILFDELRGRHRAASETLREALGGERFAGLAAELAGAVDHVPLTDDAWQPCRTVLPQRVAHAWKRLKRDGRALEPSAPDEAFHAVRKRAKRARYAAEAVRHALAPAEAHAAGRFARGARAVQDVLGAHQDAVVAANLLQQAAADRPTLGPFNFAAGRLLEVENRLAAGSRARFFKVWGKLDQRKLVRWLS